MDKFIDYVIIVEGEKDAKKFREMGFQRVYSINEDNVPFQQRIIDIAKTMDKKDRICILTSFDKNGKQLSIEIKERFQQLGISTDSSLRGLMIKKGVRDMPGIIDFMQKVSQIA